MGAKGVDGMCVCGCVVRPTGFRTILGEQGSSSRGEDVGVGVDVLGLAT